MNASVELVLADHPAWPPAKAEAEAGRRWDAAARTFIEATLSTLHTLRPRGKFGFFGWPDCDGHLTADGESLGCSDGFRAMNDRDLGWLWNASSALFPSTCVSLPCLHIYVVSQFSVFSPYTHILLSPIRVAPISAYGENILNCESSSRSRCDKYHKPLIATGTYCSTTFGQILHSRQGSICTRGTGKI